MLLISQESHDQQWMVHPSKQIGRNKNRCIEQAHWRSRTDFQGKHNSSLKFSLSNLLTSSFLSCLAILLHTISHTPENHTCTQMLIKSSRNSKSHPQHFFQTNHWLQILDRRDMLLTIYCPGMGCCGQVVVDATCFGCQVWPPVRTLEFVDLLHWWSVLY